MEITLREIDRENWRDCIALRVREDQAGFVGTNENALALAYVHTEMRPRGIYAGDEIVGFIMYAKDPDDGFYYCNRLMVDAKHQGKGYGRRALEILLDELRSKGERSLDILHKPDNHKAIEIYKSLGFRLTDETVGDDVISRAEF